MPDDLLLGPHEERCPQEKLASGTVVSPAALSEEVLLVESGFLAALVSVGNSRICVGLLGEGSLMGERESSAELRWSYLALSTVTVARIPAPATEAARSLLSQRTLAQKSECMLQSALIAACTARHNLAQRCAHWLIRIAQHVGSRVLVTHALLAEFIGVRRAGITTMLHAWQQEGIITQGHGYITILDNERLQQKACCCPVMAASADGQFSTDMLGEGRWLADGPPAPQDASVPSVSQLPELRIANRLNGTPLAQPVLVSSHAMIGRSQTHAGKQRNTAMAEEQEKHRQLRQITELRMHHMREGLSSLQGELEKARQRIQLAERILARDAMTFDEPARSLPN